MYDIKKTGKTNFRIIEISFIKYKKNGIKHNKMYYEQIFWHLKENVQSIQIKRAFLISKDKKRCPHLYKSWNIVLNYKNERCMLSLSSSLHPFPKKSIKKTTRPTNSWILRNKGHPGPCLLPNLIPEGDTAASIEF